VKSVVKQKTKKPKKRERKRQQWDDKMELKGTHSEGKRKQKRKIYKKDGVSDSMWCDRLYFSR